MMEILLEIITKKLGYHIITLICQNHLSYDAGGSITITYAAAGIKLKKEVQGPENYTLHYIGGIEYREEAEIEIESIHHAEGRVTYDENDEAVYEYHLKDHLGNVRMAFADKDGDGDGYIEPFNVNPNEPNSGDDGVDWNLTETEILQESHYYPFGMAMDGAWQDIVNGPENNYLYNGKELNDDFDLNWSDYGARWYDPAIARWNSVDPLADMFPSQSPYNYTFNNPMIYTDPTGMAPEGLYDWDTGKYMKDGKEISFSDALSIAEQQGNDFETQAESVVSYTNNKDDSGSMNPNNSKIDEFSDGIIENGTKGTLTISIELSYVKEESYGFGKYARKSKNSRIKSLKQEAQNYPEPLRTSMINFIENNYHKIGPERFEGVFSGYVHIMSKLEDGGPGILINKTNVEVNTRLTPCNHGKSGCQSGHKGTGVNFNLNFKSKKGKNRTKDDDRA